MSIKVLNEFLPRAEQARLGAVKVGQSLNITEQGTLDVSSYMNVMARTTNVVSEIPYALNISVENGKFSAKTGTRYSFANSPYNLLPTDRQITADITGERYVCVDSYTNLVLTEAYDTNYSLPIAKISINNGKVVSIDALYPGFGATDNTIFVLPGVSGLIPAGRLANGGLNNQEFKYTEAKKVQVSEDGTYLVGCNGTDLVLLSEDVTYDADLNGNRLNDTPVNYAICGKVVVENGKITEFVSRPTFHALDYYDMDLNYAKREDLGQLAYKDKVSTSDIVAGGIAQSAVTGLTTALNNKQDTLTWDDIPKASSSNPVKSSGIYSELAKKQNNLTAGTGIDITNNVISEVSIAYVNYGTGLYADITDLIANKKIILCKYEGRIYQYTAPYTSGSASYYYFTCVDTYSSVKYLRVDQGSNWTNGSQGIQATITGAASTVTSNNLIKNRAVISNASGKIAVSDTTDTELSYVHGITSNIQTQLNEKVVKNDAIIGATHTKITYDSKGLVTGGSDLTVSDIPSLPVSKLTGVTATASELNVLDGIDTTTTALNYTKDVTSPIQVQIDTKLNYADYGLIVPDTTNMKVLKTYEYDISDTSVYTFCKFKNDKNNLADLTGDAIFRMTITGTNINQNIEGIISVRQAVESPYIVIRNRRGSSSVATTGIRSIHTCYPKTLNNGYDWLIELSAYNATTRHIKIEVLRSDTGFEWLDTATLTTYNSTYQTSASITTYTIDGIIGYPNLYWNVTSASSAGYISSYLPKLIPGTMPKTGEATLSSQFVFMSGNLIYPATNKTKAIDPGFGIVYSSTATANNNTYTYTYLRQKGTVTSLTNIPHATLATGNKVWFRCHLDNSGNIISDNYVDTEMRPGYTWYYIGVASSASALMLDLTSSIFLTLDTEGNLTHINGKKITSTDLINYAPLKSPALTGIPTTPTAAKGTNNKQIANTEYVRNELADYVTKNADITGATHTKITYDAKGLVTAGSDITLADVTDITATTTEVNYLSGVTSNVQTQLNNKANSSQLSNYQLLITSSNKLSADLLSEGSNNKLVSQAEKSTWNAKQNALTAGTNINITNNTISTNAAQVIIRRYS